MIKMLEMICAIPEEIGWSLVGFVACLYCVTAVKIGKIFVEMWRERHEEEA